MTRPDDRASLEAEHRAEAIRQRLDDDDAGSSALGDAILGAVDGCVTTFAIVAGGIGAGFSVKIVTTLGLASLLADGISMAASNYLSKKTEMDRVDGIRRDEKRHIRLHPEGEREEIRQIFERKGFEGETLDRVVDTVCSDEAVWVETMLKEEHQVDPHRRHPRVSGMSTFIAFVIAGLVPLGAYWWIDVSPRPRFLLTAGCTVITFFLIGAIKGRVLRIDPIRSGLETLGVGSIAAATAFAIGAWLRNGGGAG